MVESISGAGGTEQPKESEKLHRQNEPPKFDPDTNKKVEKEFDMDTYKGLSSDEEKDQYMKSLSKEQREKGLTKLTEEGSVMLMMAQMEKTLKDAREKAKRRKAEGA